MLSHFSCFLRVSQDSDVTSLSDAIGELMGLIEVMFCLFKKMHLVAVVGIRTPIVGLEIQRMDV